VVTVRSLEPEDGTRRPNEKSLQISAVGAGYGKNLGNWAIFIDNRRATSEPRDTERDLF